MSTVRCDTHERYYHKGDECPNCLADLDAMRVTLPDGEVINPQNIREITVSGDVVTIRLATGIGYKIVTRATPPASDEVRALRDVAAERERQKSVEGWTPEHDDQYTNAELPRAAACYATHYTN